MVALLGSCPICDWAPEPPEKAAVDREAMDAIVRGHVSDAHPARLHELPPRPSNV